MLSFVRLGKFDPEDNWGPRSYSAVDARTPQQESWVGKFDDKLLRPVPDAKGASEGKLPQLKHQHYSLEFRSGTNQDVRKRRYMGEIPVQAEKFIALPGTQYLPAPLDRFPFWSLPLFLYGASLVGELHRGSQRQCSVFLRCHRPTFSLSSTRHGVNCSCV